MTDLRREMLKHEGRLSEKEKEARKMELQIDGLRDLVRDILDPFEQIAELEIEKALENMSKLADLWARYILILAEIKGIKKMLGK